MENRLLNPHGLDQLDFAQNVSHVPRRIKLIMSIVITVTNLYSMFIIIISCLISFSL